MIPKEADGETYEGALARVCRCIGGRTATENADNDCDLEAVVAGFVPVNLRCPVSKYLLFWLSLCANCSILIFSFCIDVCTAEWFKNENCWKIQTLFTYGML